MKFRLTISSLENNGVGGDIYRDYKTPVDVDFNKVIEELLITLFDNSGDQLFSKPTEEEKDEKEMFEAQLEEAIFRLENKR